MTRFNRKTLIDKITQHWDARLTAAEDALQKLREEDSLELRVGAWRAHQIDRVLNFADRLSGGSDGVSDKELERFHVESAPWPSSYRNEVEQATKTLDQIRRKRNAALTYTQSLSSLEGEPDVVNLTVTELRLLGLEL